MSIFSPTLIQDKLPRNKMRRIFHPVGQGSFYTETFIFGSDHYSTVVYDCGVSGDAAPLVERMEALKKTYGVNISIVFISHFHADHISHIPKLLKDFSINALVIPDVTTEVAIDAFLNNYLASGKSDNSFIERLLSGESEIEGTKVIRVAQLGGEEERTISDNNFLDLKDGNFESLLATGTLSSDTIIRQFDWEYILCNYPSSRASTLVDEMGKRYPELLAVLMKQEWAEARALLDRIPFDNIAKLYKDCFPNDENEESMTVLSRPVKDDFTPSTCCLYTGDSPFRTKKRLNYVKKYYGNHWDKMGTLQTPHHGADDDNPAELHDKCRTCVVSYGTYNTYGHPGKHALINMAQAKCNIRLVSEVGASCFEKYIDY